MPMKTLGKMPEKSLEGCAPVCNVERGPYFPSCYLDSKQMPEIDEWDVGEDYVISVTVRMRSYTLNESSSGESRSSAELELISYDTKAPKSLT